MGAKRVPRSKTHEKISGFIQTCLNSLGSLILFFDVWPLNFVSKGQQKRKAEVRVYLLRMIKIVIYVCEMKHNGSFVFVHK